MLASSALNSPKYLTSPVRPPSATATVRVHDSIKEVGDKARQFLLDFSDSSIRDVSYIMRNFEPGCYGTAEEAAQVADNRAGYEIVASSVGAATVTVNFGGVCAFRAKPGDACANVPVMWDSRNLATGVRGIVLSMRPTIQQTTHAQIDADTELFAAIIGSVGSAARTD